MENKIVAITGAGGGIGRVAADIFAAEGATDLIMARTAKAVEDITTAGGKAEGYIVDISNEQAVKEMFGKSTQSLRGQPVPGLSSVSFNPTVILHCR